MTKAHNTIPNTSLWADKKKIYLNFIAQMRGKKKKGKELRKSNYK